MAKTQKRITVKRKKSTMRNTHFAASFSASDLLKNSKPTERFSFKTYPAVPSKEVLQVKPISKERLAHLRKQPAGARGPAPLDG